jgi:hypothetical protein
LKKLMMLPVMPTMVVIVVVVPTLAFDSDRFEGRFGEDLFAAGFYGGDFFDDGAAREVPEIYQEVQSGVLMSFLVSDEGDYAAHSAHLPSTSVAQATSTTHPAPYNTAA